MPTPCAAYAARDKEAHLAPITIQRRDLDPKDVKVSIEYCGVCYSDIHMARGDWGKVLYPLVPGHEIVGKVLAVGPEVNKYKPGDLVGVGVSVDSCGRCPACARHEENYCNGPITSTYGSVDTHLGGATFGGYSESIVVTERFVFSISESIYGPAAAPLLCAGITTYAPLNRAAIKPGQKVGVIGLGGLGHMGIKFAKAMGAEVFMITTSPSKGADARHLGADGVIISKDIAQMKKHKRSFDFLLNTIPTKHDVNPYLRLLKVGGTMSIVGAIEKLSIDYGLVMRSRLNLTGSVIGGTAETQKMLDFCAEKNIVADIELVPIQDINDAWGRVMASEVRYRFVIDNKTLKRSSI